MHYKIFGRRTGLHYSADPDDVRQSALHSDSGAMHIHPTVTETDYARRVEAVSVNEREIKLGFREGRTMQEDRNAFRFLDVNGAPT
jgi:hypothetical protein